jgi:hypothetical protein
MTVSTRSAPNVLLLLCSATAILMTLTGLLFSIGTHVLSTLARQERFIGETDAISIALIFGGIAAALKTIEIRLRAERDSSTE